MNDPRQERRSEIQEKCVAKMHALGLTPAEVARLAGIDNLDHVERFLTRRGTMGSAKLDKVLKALGLKVIDEK